MPILQKHKFPYSLYYGLTIVGLCCCTALLAQIGQQHVFVIGQVCEESQGVNDGSCSATVSGLERGMYFRPPPEQTSAQPGTSAKYKRSPCPLLNLLANHGLINRDGTGLSNDGLANAIKEAINLDPSASKLVIILARVLNLSIPGFSFSLSDVSGHNRLEHDASLVHNDAYFGGDPYTVNNTFFDQLAATSSNGKTLTLDDFLAFRKNRQAHSKKHNPKYYFGFLQKRAAAAEIALALLAMGKNQEVSVEDARAFFVEERFPDNYQKSKEVITREDILAISGKVGQAIANFDA